MMRPIRKLMDLRGRRALVTGGAGHIGLAIGETLVELGARVAVADLDAAACDKRAQLLNKRRRGAAFGLSFNLANEAATREAVRAATKKMGGLDILVHAAAYYPPDGTAGWDANFAGQSTAQFDASLQINLVAAFTLVHEARAALERSGRGSVIFISSIYGAVGPDFSLYEGTGMNNPAGYAAAKGGLNQTARHLATQLAPRVRVNTLSPGGVWRGQPKAFVDRYKRKTPLGRMAVEEDFKGAIAFLASDLSSYVTGQNLLVDGGWTAW